MGIPTKGPWWRRLPTYPWFWDIGLAIASFISTVVAAQLARSKEASYAVFAVGTTVSLLQVGKAIAAARTLATKQSVTDLSGCMHTLRAMLVGADSENDGNLRLTIHVPVNKDKELEQVIDYVSGGRRGDRGGGRRFSTKCGAIGEAFRTGDVSVGDWESGNIEEHIKHLTKTYGYSESEAKALDLTSKSWAALPIVSQKGQVVAVLYADATEVGYFTEDRLALMNLAAVGIAYFVGERYA